MMIVDVKIILLVTLGVGCCAGNFVAQCKKGETWKNKCNACYCGAGGVPFCTNQKCSGDVNYKSPPGECKALSKWRVDCNYCTCLDSGILSCTNENCGANELTSNRFKRSKQACNVGDSWKDDCNYCTCTELGAVCTLRFCLPNESTSKLRETRETKCTPGSKWREVCNSCYCLEDGTSACTRRICRRKRDGDTSYENRECNPAAKLCGSPSSSPESQSKKRDGDKLRGRGRCTPGSTWDQNCSTCFCGQQGNVECIVRPCPEDQMANKTRELFEMLKGRGRCEPGSTWQLTCNVCSCDQTGNLECTSKPCEKIGVDSDLEIRRKRAAESRGSTRWCKPGDSFYFNCNACPCGVSGITGCHSRTCRKR